MNPRIVGGTALLFISGVLVWLLWPSPPLPGPPPSAPPVEHHPKQKMARKASAPAQPEPRGKAPEGPLDIDVSDLLPGREAHDLEPADSGLEVTAAKVRAAQLHLLPPPADVALRALDEGTIEATVDELTPRLAACLGPEPKAGASVELLLGPILDGSKNLLQVTELPAGHSDASTLACLTEVARSAPFAYGPPTTMTVALTAAD